MADEIENSESTPQTAAPTIESEISEILAEEKTFEERFAVLELKVAGLGETSSVDSKIQALTDLLDKHGIRAQE